MKMNMFASLWVCLCLLLVTSLSRARPTWSTGEKEDLDESRSENEQGQANKLVNAFDATQLAADKTVHEIIGKLTLNKDTSTHERNVRQILHQSSSANRVLRPLQNLPLTLLNPGILQQQHFGSPTGTNFHLRQPSGLPNIGAQIASRVQHLVDAHLESTVQKNLAAHESSSNQNIYQQPLQRPQYLVRNPGINHHVRIGQPQVSIISSSQVHVTCSGNTQDCQNVPKIPLANFSHINSLDQKVDTIPSESHNQMDSSYSHNQDGGNPHQDQKTLDLIHSETSEEHHKQIDMPESNIDIRFGN